MKSLIATLDMLGVTQLMNNISADKLKDAADLMHNVFKLAKNGLRDFVLNAQLPTSVDEAGRKEILKLIDTCCDFYIFSDTIVILCNPKKAPHNLIVWATHIFFLQVRYVICNLFDKGFPVRGCIDYGAVVKDENFLLGKAYVNSYLIGESLDFSGIVVTDDARKFYDEVHINSNDEFNSLVGLMLHVPTKTGFMQLYCFNWIIPLSCLPICTIFADNENWTQRLYESMSANGKVMTEVALRKFANTKNVLRAFILQNKHWHQESPK